MASCKADAGVSNGCQDLLRVGGADKTFWAGYKSELDTQISLAQTGPIRSLDFGAYGGLRRFDGQKFSHSFGDELQKAANGGNVSYLHRLVMKLLLNSTEDDVIMQNMNLGQDIFFVIPDNNQKFFILGAGNGMSAVSDVQDSGNTGDADTSNTATFQGSELTKKLRFELLAGYQATLDYLENFEV